MTTEFIKNIKVSFMLSCVNYRIYWVCSRSGESVLFSGPLGTGCLGTEGPWGLSSACPLWATSESPTWEQGRESCSTLQSCLEEWWLLALLSSSFSDDNQIIWRSLLRRLLDLLVDPAATVQWSSWDSWSHSKRFKVFATLMVNLSEKRTLNTTYTHTVH